jgi:hypothetical protein
LGFLRDTSFDAEYADIGVFGETHGSHETGNTTPDDDVVIRWEERLVKITRKLDGRDMSELVEAREEGEQKEE